MTQSNLSLQDDDDVSDAELDRTWIGFVLRSTPYAVPARQVSEIVQLGEVTAIPESPPWTPGVMRLRDQLFRVVDLRARFGMKTIDDETAEFASLLEAREGDHVRWLNALRASVVDGVPFTLARDPTQCAFGRWYATFQSPNIQLTAQLARFDEPHRRIHALADQALGLLASGRGQEALRLVEAAELGDLQRLRDLFAVARRLVIESTRHVVLVCTTSEGLLGVLVDNVDRVCELAPDQIAPPPTELGRPSAFITGLARRGNDVVQLLDAERLRDA